MHKDDARFVSNINSYIVLTVTIMVIGVAGLLISIYAHVLHLPKMLIANYLLFALTLTIFGVLCLKMMILIRRETVNKQEDVLFTQKERTWIKNSLSKIRILGIVMCLFGAIAAIVGAYGIIYRQKSDIGRMNTALSIFYSICYVVIGSVGSKTANVLNVLDLYKDAKAND